MAVATTKQVEIFGKNYEMRKMDAKLQLHVVKRISPLFTVFAELSRTLPRTADGGIDLNIPITALKPAVEGFASLPDPDIDYIIDVAMEHASVEIEGGRGWAPMRVKGVNMIQNMEMPEMLFITAHLIWFNLARFIPAPPSDSQVGGAGAALS